MSARDELINELRQWCSASEMEWVTASFDAYAAEVRSAALREAANFIETETRNSTGNPVIFPPWAKAQQHARELAAGTRRMATEETA